VIITVSAGSLFGDFIFGFLCAYNFFQVGLSLSEILEGLALLFVSAHIFDDVAGGILEAVGDDVIPGLDPALVIVGWLLDHVRHQNFTFEIRVY
jgi:hypothetical protein